MKKAILFVLGVVGAFTTSWAQGNSGFKIDEMYRVDVAHSYLGFSVKYMGVAPVRGRFGKFDGSVRFQENDLSKTSVSLSIDVASIDTQIEFRDKDLQSDGWMSAEKFPKMYFSSKKINKTSNGFEVIGDLTIRGVTKEVSAVMENPSGKIVDERKDFMVVFGGILPINRRDFGIEGTRWGVIVGDNVNIEITIVAVRTNEINFRNRINPESPQGKIYDVAKKEGVEKAVVEFEKMKADPNMKITESALSLAGYMFLKENKTSDALVLFKKNVEAFPQSASVYTAYGEGLATINNWPEARKYYLLALEKDPNNMIAKEVLRHLP